MCVCQNLIDHFMTVTYGVLLWSQYPAHAASVQLFQRRDDEYCLKVRQHAASLIDPHRPLGGFMIALGIMVFAASGEEVPWVIG